MMGWIGAVAGVCLGILGAILGWRYWGAGAATGAAPSTEIWIWVGALGGSLIGVMGGVLGTYASIKNTQGPRERAFIIRASIVCWILVGVFLAGLFLIPGWYKFLLWIPYIFALNAGIRYWNKRQAEIRQEEAGTVPPAA
jgi:uncharacterized membrane protein